MSTESVRQMSTDELINESESLTAKIVFCHVGNKEWKRLCERLEVVDAEIERRMQDNDYYNEEE